MNTENWTHNNIPDLSEKVIIVTGGNSGLGYESVKAFAKKGAEVIMACRSTIKGEAAKMEIGNVKGKIIVMELDLMDFSSIKVFSDNFKKKHSRLDILLNNAGIMTTPYFPTKDGLEAQTGTNHFGHFALTGLLLELIKNTSKSRVVNISSIAHKDGEMDFSNLLFENGKEYTPWKAYRRSKLMNLLFTYELQRWFEENNIDSISVAAHPGVSGTNLGRYIEDKFWFKLLWPFLRFFTHVPKQAALPQIRAAISPDVKGAEYYGPHKNMRGFPVIVESTSASHNLEDSKRLWEISENITGVKYI